MMQKFLILVLLTSLFFGCSKNKNPLRLEEREQGAGHLSIQTDSMLYHWESKEFSNVVNIRGALTNTSDTLFYSSIGDLMCGRDCGYVSFSENSDAELERYDPVSGNWQGLQIQGYLIEGTVSMRLAPLNNYYIISGIISFSDTLVTGNFRYRLEYYMMETDSIRKTFHDYSNVFEIR